MTGMEQALIEALGKALADWIVERDGVPADARPMVDHRVGEAAVKRVSWYYAQGTITRAERDVAERMVDQLTMLPAGGMS